MLDHEKLDVYQWALRFAVSAGTSRRDAQQDVPLNRLGNVDAHAYGYDDGYVGADDNQVASFLG